MDLDIFHGLTGGLLVCLILVVVFGIPSWVWWARAERRSFWSWRPQGHSTLGPDATGTEDVKGPRIPG
jgi:hypothetical protein